jgi:hypothetical protein
LNPFTGQETPISTHDVRLFIQSGEKATGRINSTSQKDYDLRPEQMYNAALFIEKQGFIPVLKESGLVRERNLAVMTSQGFATRAARTQMKFFIRKGIKVYVLHDCDIYGHDIVRKIRQGSETFEEPLDVIDIGLSVADIDRLGKRPLAETVKPKGERRLRTALEGLSPQERSFFVIEKRRIYGPSDVQYRRVELNALTNDEFVAFILSKIQHEVVKPDPKDVEGCCESMLDPAAIVKEALHRVLGSKFHCAIDSRRCAERALRAINGKRHWTQAVEDEVARYVEEQIKLVSGLISKRYL